MYALLIAKDPDDKAVLALILERAGLAVTAARDLDRGLQSWSKRPIDLIVLTNEELDAAAAVRRIRSDTEVPVLVACAGLDEELHRQLLELGADLVVSTPYSARLLITQVRALMRRAGGVQLVSLPNLKMGPVTLDPATRTVEVSGQARRRLTHLEFRLLYTLMLHRGQILSPEVIVERVWGYSGRGDKELVRGLVRRLRSKVELDPSCPHHILTIPRVGYSFSDDLPHA